MRKSKEARCGILHAIEGVRDTIAYGIGKKVRLTHVAHSQHRVTERGDAERIPLRSRHAYGEDRAQVVASTLECVIRRASLETRSERRIDRGRRTRETHAHWIVH
jgi:hypothetical protein